ncbi:hypothetical protein [Nevskia sp.]|uniref:hypothetical protein n=1 Tax=Nevskia sp. TaxID=1929292 RepID=UPI0025F810D7|nr:hypothetical protein [Nevskia sp.]
MACTYCGSNDHNIVLCPKTVGGSSARRHLRCAYCGKTDHDIKACPKTYSGSAARASHPESVADHFIKD